MVGACLPRAGRGAAARTVTRRVIARVVVGGVVAAVAIVAAMPRVGPAGAGARPTDWCAPEPSTTDRPDAVAGHQIHVVYAHPADVPDRTTELAPRIVRDLGGIDAWWREQDPGRTPRFDLADFPGCDSELGALDLTTLALPGPAADYANSDAHLAGAVRPEIGRVFGPRLGTVYLVYLDAPVDPFEGRVVCGLAYADLAFVFLQQPTCSAGGGLGSGNGWPAGTAAHELTHLFTRGSLLGAPHACPDDDGHVCDPGSADLLDTSSVRTSPYLTDMTLDPGRDDYYGHGVAGRHDARESDFLARLDRPQQPVSVTIAPDGGGQVRSAGPGLACPPTCTLPYDGGTAVQLLASPADGYEFRGWEGGCRGRAPQCSFVADQPVTATARFRALVPYTVRVVGDGEVTDRILTCTGRCTWRAAANARVDLYAKAGPKARFRGWSGPCRGSGAHCRVRVDDATRVVAKFARR